MHEPNRNTSQQTEPAMKHGLVFGKFMPFHKGHEALINFARQHCAQLTVLICCSDQETLPAEVRLGWLQQTFAGVPGLNLQVLEYSEKELPNTSVSSVAVANVWADRFRALLPDCDLVVTSEPYGELVAARMGILHQPFDLPRQLVPVSATAIRAGLEANWQFLPASVRPYYTRKVVLLGTESTGKSTLAAQLAAHFQASLVTEAGRDLIPDSSSFGRADLLLVAHEHARRIEVAQAAGHSPLLIIDTDIHITQSYAHFALGEKLEVPEAVYALNRADLYLYLAADVPYVQDGTRLPADERLRLDHSHRQTLARYGVSFVEISGSWSQRFQRAVALVEQLLLSQPIGKGISNR